MSDRGQRAGGRLGGRVGGWAEGRSLPGASERTRKECKELTKNPRVLTTLMKTRHLSDGKRRPVRKY